MKESRRILPVTAFGYPRDTADWSGLLWRIIPDHIGVLWGRNTMRVNTAFARSCGAFTTNIPPVECNFNQNLNSKLIFTYIIMTNGIIALPQLKFVTFYKGFAKLFRQKQHVFPRISNPSQRSTSTLWVYVDLRRVYDRFCDVSPFVKSKLGTVHSLVTNDSGRYDVFTPKSVVASRTVRNSRVLSMGAATRR